MKRFDKALNKATKKRDAKKPKTKHLLSNIYIALENAYNELPFTQVSDLLLRSLKDKKQCNIVRALIVVYYLMNKKKQEVLNWFQTVDLSIEFISQYNLLPITVPLFQYLKLKSRSNQTMILFLTPSLLENTRANPSELIQKTNEIVELMNSLTAMKEILTTSLKYKNVDDLNSELCIWVLADSKIIYNSLKNAVGSVWQIFSTLELYNGNRAREIFIRYNELVSKLKDFAERCPEEYPGQIPTYSMLSAETMEQVNIQVTGKENLKISTDLLKFDTVEKECSPVKISKDLHSTDTNEEITKIRNSQSMMFPINQSMQLVNGYPIMAAYPANMFYQPQFYYQPFPPNR